MVVSPCHVPMDQIEFNVKKQMEECNEASFYVLGPLLTDIAPGYDHITAAIGTGHGVLASHADALLRHSHDYLSLSNADDVREGLSASKIAEHAADIASHRPRVGDRDDELSRVRYAFDWNRQFELLLDPERVKQYLDEILPADI